MDTAREFTDRLVALLRSERSTLADFILELAELDRRELYRGLGYASLFQFLQRELGLSDGLAYFRMRACRLVREFPEVIEPLRDGRLCVTNVVELAKVMTPENRHEVLSRYFHVSKREAEAITVSIQPKGVVPTRSVVTPVHAAALVPEKGVAAEPERDAEVGTKALQPVVVEAVPRPVRAGETPPRRAEVEPLTQELARLHLTVPARLLEKIAAARDALSHVKPGATDAEVLEAALDELLEKAARRKGLTERPLTTPRASQGGAIPAHVKREVWTRDEGRCQAPLGSGGVCGSTHQLEFHHRHARALGGPPTADNIELRCRLHNLEAARDDFGDAWMAQFSRRARRSPTSQKRDTGAGPPVPP